jgi:cell division protein FtsQ
MDGGRRLLRPVKEVFAAFEPSLPAYVGLSNDLTVARVRPAMLAPARNRNQFAAFLMALVAARGVNTFLSLAFLAAVGIYGCVLNGQYKEFTATYGSLPDLVARTAGFRLKTVTILGIHELTEKEIVDTAGITSTNSLVFLDAVKLRARLKTLPFVKEASVAKLYPNRLLIEIQERKPVALWQKDGQTEVVAADGTPIDGLHDARYLKLPRAVGEGANAHISEYLGLLTAAGDLRSRIDAGIYVAGRRWTLKFKNGIEVALPERNPAAAVAELATLEQDHHVLDKDVLALDLRVPGRLIATLPDDVARARMEPQVHKSTKKGGQT